MEPTSRSARPGFFHRRERASRAGDLFGSLSVTNEFKAGSWKIAPYARLDLQSIRLDGYAESGAGVFDLTFNQTSAFDLAGLVGTKLSHVMDTSAGALKSSLELAYRHGFSGAYTQTVYYTIAPITLYDLYGIAEKRDQALIGLGFELQVNQSLSLGARFDGSIANHATSEGGRLRARLAF